MSTVKNRSIYVYLRVISLVLQMAGMHSLHSSNTHTNILFYFILYLRTSHPVLSSRSAMLPRLPVYILIFLPVLLVQGSTADSSKKSPAAPASPPPHPPPLLGDPSWALGLRLYQALRSDSSTVNTLFSPLLVASSLGALGGGSAGTTASQLQDLLKSSSPAKAGAHAGELLSESLKSFTESNGSSFHLHTSSALFSKEAPPVSKVFVKDSQARFRLQHQPLGKGDSKADLKQLNGWAKAGLGGLEGAPLAAEIQAKTGALILANALSFKGE